MKKIKDIITLEQVLEARREGLIEATEQRCAIAVLGGKK